MDRNFNLFKWDSKIKLVVEGIIVGIGSGLLSILYRYIIHFIDEFRPSIFGEISPLKIVLLIFSAIAFSFIVSFLLKWAPLSGGSGIPQIRGEVFGTLDDEPEKTLISKFIGGIIGSIMGLSLGREGPSIQIGGSFAKLFSKHTEKSKEKAGYIITAGASAGLSAAFNAPISATLFALEEVHKSFSPLVLVSSIVASVIANFLSFKILGQSTAFSFIVEKNLPVELFIPVFLTGIISGIVGVIFNIGIVRFKNKLSEIKTIYRLLGLMFLSIFIGFLAYSLVSGGHGLLEKLAEKPLSLKILLLLLLGKMVYTWICYGTGIQGGIFLPTLVCGGIAGAICFNIVGLFIEIDPYYVNLK